MSSAHGAAFEIGRASTAGRCAVVTGAGGGIGSSILARLRADGCRVVAADIAPPSEEQTDNLRFVVADITDADAVDDVFGLAVQEFGAVDYVVHAAGTIHRSALLSTELNTWQRIFRENAEGAFVVARAAGRLLTGRPHAAIVTIVSLASVSGGTGIGAYAAAKGAVGVMTRVLALELASEGVRVNSVAPGVIDTAMLSDADPSELARIVGEIPLARLGVGADVAGAVAFLLSPDAAYVTGQMLVVDGGLGSR